MSNTQHISPEEQAKYGDHELNLIADANAALIASAPELLDLCERALRALHEDDFPLLREDIRKGMAKAEGRAE
jgi:hypothetical protein